jgi:hypothetical protein
MLKFNLNNINIEKTMTRILVYNIRDSNPDAVKFVVNESAINSILLYLKCKKYTTLLLCFGHLFLLELLYKYEELELYEDCQLIVNAINDINKTVNSDLETY